MITLDEIKKNESIRALVKAGNKYLEALGFTDHGPRHLSYVSRIASYILKALGYSEREIELAAIAGWVHDVGNSINRHDHGPNGAIMLFPILKDAGMAMPDVVEIITAVGNHEEQSGSVSSAVSAALIIADKSDAHKSRVRNGRPDPGDVHDRVNFSIQQNDVTVDRKTRLIRQSLVMDRSSSVLEYLSIYMPRIILCEKAAAFLGQEFQLVINGHAVNNQSPTPQVVEG
ncbi:MAG: HD domain-containing protein [Candidatus Limiplasma sp.]|nr:HD domain-containing protein [Candidatus Limiplasma sp.]